MIVDASAMVAILVREPEAADLSVRLDRAPARFTHPVSVYEAAQAISRMMRVTAGFALADVEHFLAEAELVVVPIDAATVATAIGAHLSYGKGRHPAKLNMGDCFSYACAKLRGMPLLYKGGDFALTDLA